LLGRIHHDDIRSHSVNALAKRYHVDLEQTERVKETSRHCFKQLETVWNLDAEEHLQWIEWAAALCEIGLDIAHSHYQKHGAYIIENSDLAGFSKQEQLRLATLVLAHRRKLPTEAINILPDYWHELTKKLAIILRLAVILNRSRVGITNQFQLDIQDQKISLHFEQGWLADHSLTEADLELEAEFLAKEEITLLFI